MPLVADASAVAHALLERTETATRLRGLLRADVVHAPHLVDVELGQILRRYVRLGEVDAAEAEGLLELGFDLVDARYGLDSALAAAAWGLRDNVSFYDATYAALASALSLTLLTADGRLARAPGLPCAVELVA